jgi:uncharacterized protein
MGQLCIQAKNGNNGFLNRVHKFDSCRGHSFGACKSALVNIVIPGGSGQAGAILRRSLTAAGHDVVVLSRSPSPAEVRWDARTVGAWARELEGADAVVNLAGRSVNCRYTPANRRAIMDSRVDSTAAVGNAIAACKEPPRVWLQASTATIYAHRYDAPNDESTGILGGGEPDAPDTWRFSIDVARAWERALDAAATPRTRKIAMRSAMIMSPDRGGVFDVLLGLVRLHLGGTIGNGRQYVSWLHDDDFARAVQFLIERDDLAGPVNLASPSPLPNRGSCARYAKRGAPESDCPRPSGCSRSARSRCAARASWS